MATTSQIAQLYEKMLGRAPDQGGMDFYSNSGMDLNQISADMSRNAASDTLAGGWGVGETERNGVVRALTPGEAYVGQWDSLNARPEHQANVARINQQLATAYPNGGTAQVMNAGSGGGSDGGSGDSGGGSGDSGKLSPGSILQESIDALRGAGQANQAAQITAPNVTPNTIAGTSLDPYLNPYTQNVIDTTLGTMEDQRLQVQNKNDGAAAAAGAFGGSRHGILGAETNAAFADNAYRTTALLNQDNHNSALNLAGSDVNSLNGMAQYNATNQMNANTLNANALNNMSQFNSKQGLNVGNSLLSASGQMFGMQNTANQNLANDGAMQQSAMQDLINSIKGQTAGSLSAPGNSLGATLAALGGIPGQGGTATQSKKNGMTDWLALLL